MPSIRPEWLLAAPFNATNPKADTPLFPYLARILRGEDLGMHEASAMLECMLAPKTGSNQIAAILTALTAKGETSAELAGMAAIMKREALAVRSRRALFDISGTGSSTAKTFNVSTAAAIVAAGAGLDIAKQSLKAHASLTGSADVLAELGIKPAVDPASAESAISGTGVAFFNAPKFHPSMTRIANVRSSLGIRTCLNVLGLLANPANATRRLIGVWHRSLVEPVANALALLGVENAWVVNGDDGIDEVSIAGRTLVATAGPSGVKVYKVSPKDFGLKAQSTEYIKAVDAKHSAAIISEVLESRRRDAARSLIVVNAATALYVGGISKDPMHAARLAEQSIDSGMAQNKLERLRQVTNKK